MEQKPEKNPSTCAKVNLDFFKARKFLGKLLGESYGFFYVNIFVCFQARKSFSKKNIKLS